MSELLEEKIDRLIVGGARITEKGRLDFPDRLPFCPNDKCVVSGCIYRKLFFYMRSNGRLGDENCLAIGKCKPVKMNKIEGKFPLIDIFSRLDFLS